MPHVNISLSPRSVSMLCTSEQRLCTGGRTCAMGSCLPFPSNSLHLAHLEISIGIPRAEAGGAVRAGQGWAAAYGSSAPGLHNERHFARKAGGEKCKNEFHTLCISSNFQSRLTVRPQTILPCYYHGMDPLSVRHAITVGLQIHALCSLQTQNLGKHDIKSSSLWPELLFLVLPTMTVKNTVHFNFTDTNLGSSLTFLFQIYFIRLMGIQILQGLTAFVQKRRNWCVTQGFTAQHVSRVWMGKVMKLLDY